MPPAESVDTVLLDVDGTLVDSTYLHALAWQRAFVRHELAPESWRVHRAIGMGGDRLVEELCGAEVERRLGDELRAEWEDEYAALLPQVRPLPRAADLVRHLAGLGLRVALASSGKKRFTDAAIGSLGLDADDFAAVTSSEDAEESKPQPDILGVALERAGGRRAVVVGDSVWDIESAGRLGADAVAVRTGGFSAAELNQAGAALVVDDVAALVDGEWRP